MKTKQILIAGGIIVVAAFSLPYLTNTDFFRGALITVQTQNDCPRENIIQLTAGENPRYIYQSTHTLDDNRTIPVYKDLTQAEITQCIGEGS